MASLCFLFVSCFAFLSIFITTSADEHERRLYNKLFSNYSIYERPVKNYSDAILVKFQLVLNQLVDVDEKNQTIQLNLWLKYEWTDYNLVWNVSEFGGITDLSIPAGTIWKPDILLYNSAGANFDMAYPVNYIVYNDGTINWLPPGILKSSCKMDVKWFPFDDQRCQLKFGSWSYGIRKLNLTYTDPGWDMSEYTRNGEWDIMNHSVTRSDKPYDCCRDAYVDLNFFLHVRRRTLYYGFNKIVPSLLIAVIATLSFALPVESIEKITLEVTIFLAMYLFLEMLSSITPPTSDALPFMCILFSSIMILVTTSVVFNIMTLNMHYRTAYKCVMSPVIRTILLKWLPPLLCMRPPRRRNRRNRAFRQEKRKRSSTSRNRESANGLKAYKAETNGGSGILHCQRDRGQITPAKENAKIFSRFGNEQIGTVLFFEAKRNYRELRLIAREMKRKDDVYVRAENEWRYAARVIDKLCLIILFTLVVVASLIVALSSHRILG